MIRIASILFYVIACLLWGNRDNWKDYYPSILFAIIGDLIYNFIFHDFTLWKYSGWANHTIANLTYMFVVYPCAINLYLTRFPKGLWKGGLYILLWTAFNSALEQVSFLTGFFAYENGWNALWSVGMFLAGFSLIKLHFHRPFIVWPISAFLLATAMLIFKIPFALIK